jgi:hypothetical protein
VRSKSSRGAFEGIRFAEQAFHPPAGYLELPGHLPFRLCFQRDPLIGGGAGEFVLDR